MVLSVFALAVLTTACVELKRVLSLVTMVWKFVPFTVTAVAGLPTLGVKPVIVGTVETVTVNAEELVAEPLGETTFTVPVVAPDGTDVTI